METRMKKEYELLYVRVDNESEKVFISGKVKKSKLTKRMPKFKSDINAAVQIKDDEKEFLSCTERCFITIRKGKTQFDQHVKGKHSIRVYHDTVTLIRM